MVSEITIFGPSYGESILVNLGEDHWILIDSCLNPKTKQPAPLEYLKEKGLDPHQVLKLIVISHWHDDHIKGMAQIVSECPTVEIVMSGALLNKEFIAYVEAFTGAVPITGGNGTREMNSVLKQLFQTSIKPTFASPNRVLARYSSAVLGTAEEAVIHALSPSDEQFSQFIAAMAMQHREIGEPGKSAVRQSPNHVAIVIWIEVGDFNILLGSDLEETGNPDLGWSAILNSKARPNGKASIYKVAHHGSLNGDHEKIWDELLKNNPLCILTPFVRGNVNLPKQSDALRILGYTDSAYVTSNNLNPKKNKRSSVVRQKVRSVVKSGSLKRVDHLFGQVTLRNDSGDWIVVLAENSMHLSEIV